MKAILSISIVGLIYLGAHLNIFQQVDYTGIYRSTGSNPKIVLEQLDLNEDQSFRYKVLVFDGGTNESIIKGTYSVKGHQLRLMPNAFETKQQELNTKVSTSNQSPRLFKRKLSRFETNASRLKPKYHIKQYNGTLSLCALDVATDLYAAKFSKQEK